MNINEEVTPNKIQQEIKKNIQYVSSNSKFQHKLIIFFGFVGLMITLQLYSVSLFYMNPVFKCEGQEGKVFEEEACERIQSCSIINTETITAELHLYCDSKKHDRTLLQTTNAIGGIIGIFLAGLSDRIGKKYNFCLCMLVLNFSWILQLIGVYTQDIFTLFVAELIAGITNKGIYIIFLVLLTRFLRRQDYQWGTVICFTAYHGLSQIALAALNSAFHDWRAIVYVYAVGISISSIFSLFFLKEDPVFLFQEGRIEEVKKVVEEIGLHNGKDDASIKHATDNINNLFDAKLLKSEQKFKIDRSFDLKEIIRWDILQKVLIIGIAGFFTYLSGKSIEFSIQSLEYSFNFNLFIVGLANICGFASASYIIKREPQRKRGLIYTSILYGVIALLILFQFCEENGSVETAVVFILRFFLCWSCNFYTRLKVDSFPEKYQMTIISLVQFISSLGMVVSPVLVQASVDHRISPILAIAVLRLVIGTAPAFFLVEEKVCLGSCQKSEETEKPVEFLQEFQ